MIAALQATASSHSLPRAGGGKNHVSSTDSVHKLVHRRVASPQKGDHRHQAIARKCRKERSKRGFAGRIWRRSCRFQSPHCHSRADPGDPQGLIER